MKSLTFMTLLLVLLFLVSFCSQKSKEKTLFEGSITTVISSNADSVTTDYYVKDKKTKTITTIKSDANTKEEMCSIYNGNKIFTLFAKQKMYMEVDYDLVKKTEDLTNIGQQQSNSYEEIDLTNYKTGKTKTILGYKCEEIFFTENGSKNTIWVTNEIGNLQMPITPIQQNSFLDKSLNDKNYFAILFTTTDKNDKLISKIEVKSISKTTLDDSLFTPPSDYSKMDLSQVKFD